MLSNTELSSANQPWIEVVGHAHKPLVDPLRPRRAHLHTPGGAVAGCALETPRPQGGAPSAGPRSPALTSSFWL